MTQKELPSQERLAEVLNYSVVTGMVTRRIRTSPNTTIGREAGSTNANGYRNIMIDGKLYTAHRLIWKLVTGEDPRDMFIDHVDGNKLNNSWHNLRLATRANNGWNIPKPSRNKTGFKGVSRERGRFKSQIMVRGKKISLGYFDTPEEAHDAYCQAADRLHGEYANY